MGFQAVTLTFRRFNPRDRSDCVRVFGSNQPKFFRESELPDFEAFIDSAACPFFVVEQECVIVGCGLIKMLTKWPKTGSHRLTLEW
jgi:hypothetical protein